MRHIRIWTALAGAVLFWQMAALRGAMLGIAVYLTLTLLVDQKKVTPPDPPKTPATPRKQEVKALPSKGASKAVIEDTERALRSLGFKVGQIRPRLRALAQDHATLEALLQAFLQK